MSMMWSHGQNISVMLLLSFDNMDPFQMSHLLWGTWSNSPPDIQCNMKTRLMDSSPSGDSVMNPDTLMCDLICLLKKTLERQIKRNKNILQTQTLHWMSRWTFVLTSSLTVPVGSSVKASGILQMDTYRVVFLLLISSAIIARHKLHIWLCKCLWWHTRDWVQTDR